MTILCPKCENEIVLEYPHSWYAVAYCYPCGISVDEKGKIHREED